VKRINLPSFLDDHNSLWNPLIEAYLCGINALDDKSHVLSKPAGLRLGRKKTRVMINPDVLAKYGSVTVSLKKDNVIFNEGEEALHYFQVVKGAVKMVTLSPDGQEFIQGIFKTDDSFGEPPLFCSFPYPSSAVALEPTVVIKLSKDNFYRLLRENFDIHLHMDQVLCQRLRYKSMVLSEISFYDPEHRIMSLLRYMKGEAAGAADKRLNGMVRSDHQYTVPFTRQQLADMSGLRVETVIRTVKKMEEDGKLKIVGRKIQF
jgi:CRP/FNR family transcriptional regulator, cyclic AMP receptor protein